MSKKNKPTSLRKNTRNAVLAAIQNFNKNDEKTAAEFLAWHDEQQKQKHEQSQEPVGGSGV